MRCTVSSVLVFVLGALCLSELRAQGTEMARVPLDELVAMLGSDRRRERVNARCELLARGESIRTELTALKPPPGFEAQRNYRYILAQLPPEPRSHKVPGGTYTVGSRDLFDDNPSREVTLSPFTMDETEVTCVEYLRFLRSTRSPPPPPSGWEGGFYAYGFDRFPVVNVSYEEAQRYARWAGGALPTAEQWEVAAHTGAPKKFSWGNELGDTLRNAAGRLLPVKSEPRDVTDLGCFDMTGSVQEFVTLGADKTPAYRGGYFLSRRVDQLHLTRKPLRVKRAARRPTVGFRIVNRR